MICFPNGKINLGLNILNKRPDGYHNIESVLYPVPLFDVMEIRPANSFKIHTHGIKLEIASEQNLVTKTWNLLARKFHIPAVKVHLLKNIPAGSGLGGGSADASFFLSQLNQLFSLGLDRKALINLAMEIGSDCPFFIDNLPSFISGRGEKVKTVKIFLKDYFLVLVFPNIPVYTENAYSKVSVNRPEKKLHEIVNQPINTWKDDLVNDFEKQLFIEHQELGRIKELLYHNGALYAAMTGSGSAIFGIFKESHKDLQSIGGYKTWIAKI